MKNNETDPTLHIVESKEQPSSDETQILPSSRMNYNSSSDPRIPRVEAKEQSTTDATKKTLADHETKHLPATHLPLSVIEVETKRLPAADTPPPPDKVVHTKKAHKKKPQPAQSNKHDKVNARILEESCRQLCLSNFFREHAPVRSLGFTSSIQGEGKSFLALTTARVLANDSINPVTFVECNWEHPTLHEHFGIPATPGLAEWLRGMCDEEDIRYQAERNLTVIPAGDGSQDVVKLLTEVHHHGLLEKLGRSDELFIVELPPIITTGYGTLAASLLESIVIVVRSQVTPDNMVVETCKQLKDLPVHGIILNQRESGIPQWIRQLL